MMNEKEDELLIEFYRELDRRYENYSAEIDEGRSDEYKAVKKRLAAELRILRCKFGLLIEKLNSIDDKKKD